MSNSKATRSDVENAKVSVEGMADLACKMGYKEKWGQLQFNNGASATDLFNFFEDNPGAIEAVYNWVLEHSPLEEESEEEECDEDSDE